jgi:MFS family permease
MAMGLAHGAAAPVFGWLSDKIGGRILMLVGLAAVSATLVLTSTRFKSYNDTLMIFSSLSP